MAKVSGSRGLNFSGAFDIDEIIRNQNKVIAGFGDLKRAAEQAVNAGGTSPVNSGNGNALRQQQLLTAQALRDARLETERLRQEEQALLVQTARTGAQTAANTQQLTANRLAQQQLTAQNRAARLAMTGASGSYREAQQRLTQLGNQIRNVQGGFSALGRVQQARIAEYRRLNDQLTEFDRRLGNNQRNVGNYRSALNGVGGTLTGLVAGYVSAAAAISAVSATFQQALKSDAIRASLEFTFGSVDLVDAKLAQLGERAELLGLNYNSLTNTYKSFTGAVIASNFNFQEGERIFNAVSGAASRLKLSGDQLEGSLLAIQQMISKGNVQAEELRGQLGERLPGAFAIAARAMGITETQLNKMLQKGEVLAADLLPKLATELEKTFDTNTTTKVDGLTAASERFYNVFSTGGSDSRISKFFEGFVDGIGRAAKAIKDMVNSSSWAELSARLFVSDDGATGDAIRGIGSSFDKGNKVLGKATNIDLTTADAKTITLTYEELNIQLQNATKSLDEYKKRIADGTLVDQGRVSLEQLTNVVDQLNAKVVQFNKFVPKLKDRPKEETTAEKQAREKEERAVQSAITSRNALQLKIDEINKASLRKQGTQDEEEIQAVKDKYIKIRAEIDEFYRKSGKRALVDVSGLKPSEARELDEVRAKQAVEVTKTQIDSQKVLFKEYEDYKNDVGAKAAGERFSADLRGYTEFVAYLRSLQPSESDQSSYANKLRDVLKKAIPEAEKEQLKSQEALYTKLLSETSSFADDRADIIRRGEEGVKVLRDKFELTRAKKLEENNAAELEAFDQGYKEKLPALKKLYDGIDRLSDESAERVLKNAREALDELVGSGKISKEVADEIRRLLADTDRELAERLPDRLINIANKIDGIVDAVGGADSAFGKLLSTVSNVVGQVGNIKKGLLDFKAAQGKGDILGSIGAGLGIVGAGISIFSSVFKLFDKSAQREEQAAYARELQDKQTEALNKSLERQIELLDKVYGTDRIEKYNEAITQARENEAKYAQDLQGRLSLTSDKTLDKYIQQFNETGKVDPFLKSTIDQIRNSGKYNLPTDINSLQSLLDEGKLDSSTAVIVENLIKANKSAIELANNLDAERIGSSLSQVADQFIATLTDGTQDFGKSFEDTIRTSILNGFKGQLIKEQLQSFYSQFAQLSEGGLTSDEIEALRASYITASEKAKADILALEKATGINLTGSETGAKANSLQGSIKASLTEETGSILAGAFNGMRLSLVNIEGLIRSGSGVNAQLANLAQQNLNGILAIQANTFRTANNTDRLEAVEGQLGAIAKNTGDTLSVQLRAAGKFNF